MNRILWNERPERDRPGGGGGDIDEVVLHDVKLVHVEQLDDRCWWIGLHMDDRDGPYWMGCFVADSRGRMQFVEQENNGIEWDQNRSHQDDRQHPIGDRHGNHTRRWMVSPRTRR